MLGLMADGSDDGSSLSLLQAGRSGDCRHCPLPPFLFEVSVQCSFSFLCSRGVSQLLLPCNCDFLVIPSMVIPQTSKLSLQMDIPLALPTLCYGFLRISFHHVTDVYFSLIYYCPDSWPSLMLDSFLGIVFLQLFKPSGLAAQPVVTHALRFRLQLLFRASALSSSLTPSTNKW